MSEAKEFWVRRKMKPTWVLLAFYVECNREEVSYELIKALFMFLSLSPEI